MSDLPISDYLVAARFKEGADAWNWIQPDRWGDRPAEDLRAVHFHVDEVSEEHQAFLMELPNLVALAFCEDHTHTPASFERIKAIMAAKEIVELEFERNEHLAWLEQFPALQRLRLRNLRGFEEPELAAIGALGELRELNLGGRDLTNEALKAIVQNKPRLTQLDLSGNDELTDLSPLRGLSSLEQLNLHGTKPDGLAPLAGLSALRVLDLSQCPVDGEQLRHLSGLSNLRTLRLSGCPVDDAGLAHIDGLSLERLDLRGVAISSAELLRRAPTLSLPSLDASVTFASERTADGGWDHKRPTEFKGALDTVKAAAHGGYLGDPGSLDFLPYLPAIEALDLADCWPLTKTDLQRVSELSGLKELNLSGVQVQGNGEDPEDLDDEGHLNARQVLSLCKGLPALEVLDLRGAELGTAGLNALTRLTSLRRLSLSGPGLATGLAKLGELPLVHLQLESCDLDDAALLALPAWPLEVLDLSGSRQLEGPGLARFGSTLRVARLNGSTVRDLSGLAGAPLEELLLITNAEKDLAPLKGMTTLRRLAVGAGIADDQGEVLASLTGLEALDLATSGAGDATVAALASLPALRVLDLQRTRISDASVPTLAGMSLRSLNLSSVWLSDESRAALQAAGIEELTVTDLGSLDDGEDRGEFAGLKVTAYTGSLPDDPTQNAWRVGVLPYEAQFPLALLLERFVSDPAASKVTALVIGGWESVYDTPPSDAFAVLTKAKLPALRALYVGDLEAEECEISWIHQEDYSPILAAFPALEELKVRGSENLSFGQPIQHEGLRKLVIECGGLPGSVLRRIAEAQLPNLEHLELYLGTEDYGWDGSVEDLTPLVSGKRFPRLTTLALRDSELADEVAVLVAESPVLERLKALDLSLGTIGDEGAQALLASPAVAKLERLDLHHHFMGEAMEAKVKEAFGERVDVSDRQEPDDWGDGELHRFVAVGE